MYRVIASAGVLLFGCLAVTLAGCAGRSTEPGARPAGNHAAAAVHDRPAAALADRARSPAADSSSNIPTPVCSTPREDHEREMGPPPPGYIRIIGGVVPGWTPASMRVPPPRSNAWTCIGPQPIQNEYWSGGANASGRVVGLAPHPTDANTVYIASASGGVWKTTDGGVTWLPLTDALSCLNHGAITLDPSDPNTV